MKYIILNLLLAFSLAGCTTTEEVTVVDQKRAYETQIAQYKEAMVQYAKAYQEYTEDSTIVDISISPEGKISNFRVGNQLLKAPVAPVMPKLPVPPKGTGEILMEGWVASLGIVADVARGVLPIKYVVDGQTKTSGHMKEVAVAAQARPVAPNVTTNTTTTTTTSGDTITSGDDYSGQINGDRNGEGNGDITSRGDEIISGDDSSGQTNGDNNGAGDRNPSTQEHIDNSNQGNPQHIVGCMDTTSSSYNPFATISGACLP